LTLTSADFNEQVRPGGLLNLKVKITNSGFAALMNPRPLYVVLVAQDVILHYEGKLELDPRTWQPGSSAFTASLRLPSKITEGEYNLALWLPDEAETLQANPHYAVRFANEEIWDEATGYNLLGKVNVDASVTGSYARTDLMQVAELRSAEVIPLATATPPPLATPISGDMINNLTISNGPENILLSFDYVSGNYNAIQLFVDTDQNPNTGYLVNGVGVDMLFENDTWNIYAGTGTEWNWEPTEVWIPFENTGQHVNWEIPRSLLNSFSFDILLQLVDMNWNAVFTTQKTTYNVK
jgi:hypothetical protein